LDGNPMFIVPIAGIVALISAYFFYNSICGPKKECRMEEIAGYVREGAYAYLIDNTRWC
jgi:Na+/H+-translocating membrane pyrophosphatase